MIEEITNVFYEKSYSEKLTDSEIVMFLAKHIENPCTCEVNGVTHNIRNFYLRVADETLPNLTNPFATEFLRNTIKRYQ